jgi:hypothetical protein
MYREVTAASLSIIETHWYQSNLWQNVALVFNVRSSDAVYVGVNRARYTKTKVSCKLCSSTTIVNAFKIGLDGIVGITMRQK